MLEQTKPHFIQSDFFGIYKNFSSDEMWKYFGVKSVGKRGLKWFTHQRTKMIELAKNKGFKSPLLCMSNLRSW